MAETKREEIELEEFEMKEEIFTIKEEILPSYTVEDSCTENIVEDSCTKNTVEDSCTQNTEIKGNFNIFPFLYKI